MIVVDATNTTHTSNIIPRYTPSEAVVYELYNESTREVTIVPNTFVLDNGVFRITYDFTFSNGDKFQVKITEGDEVVYRGKLIAIIGETQEYNPTDGLYTYSTI